jgi:hypothetical protein
MKKPLPVCLTVILLSFAASAFGQSNPFTDGRWQGRISYRDAGGKSRSELYELILVQNGTCIVTVSGKRDGADVFQDTDGEWYFDENVFGLDCNFPEPVFEHLPAVKWASVYEFDALKTRFTLLIKPYPDAPNVIKAAFNKVDD